MCAVLSAFMVYGILYAFKSGLSNDCSDEVLREDSAFVLCLATTDHPATERFFLMDSDDSKAFIVAQGGRGALGKKLSDGEPAVWLQLWGECFAYGAADKVQLAMFGEHFIEQYRELWALWQLQGIADDADCRMRLLTEMYRCREIHANEEKLYAVGRLGDFVATLRHEGVTALKPSQKAAWLAQHHRD